MMRFVIVFLAFALLPIAVVAEEESEPVDYSRWQVSSNITLSLTQATYSNSWKGGEANSLTWTVNSLTVAEKQILAKVFNKNTLKLDYGLTYNQDPESDDWGSGNKSTDLVDLESTFRMTLHTFLEPILAFRGITQFDDRSERSLDTSYPTKDRSFNPLELTESIGLAHVFFKEKAREWQTRIGMASKQIIDRDRLDLASGERSTNSNVQGGFELVNDLKLPIAKDKMEWTSKLSIFQSVYSNQADDLKGTPQEDDYLYPDINFENILTAKVTRLVAVNLYVQLLYDREIDRAARFKQTLALGLSYKLI